VDYIKIKSLNKIRRLRKKKKIKPTLIMNKCLNLRKMNKLTKLKRNNIIINIATMEVTAADFVNPLNLLLLFEYIYINTNFIFFNI
jgi:hypothetical protein